MIRIAAILILCAGCNGTRIRPMIEVEHRRAHEVETRVGAGITTKNSDLDVYWAPIINVRDYPGNSVKIPYPAAFGIRWRLK